MAGIAEFMATLLFLYITVLTVLGVGSTPNKSASVGIQWIAWAFSNMIFALVYCTAGVSGVHINPAVSFGLHLSSCGSIFVIRTSRKRTKIYTSSSRRRQKSLL